MPIAVSEMSEAECRVAAASPGLMNRLLARVNARLDAQFGPVRDPRGLLKSKPKYKIAGVASTEHRDQEGDVVMQDGLDWRPFLAYGFFNDNHSDGTCDVLGYPTKVYAMTLRDGDRRVKATAVEGFLFNTPAAERLAATAMAMEGTPRQFGLSVEGPPPQRDPVDKKLVVAGLVRNVAITNCPVNARTYVGVQLAKSLDAARRLAGMRKAASAGHPGGDAGNLRPIMPESLGGLAGGFSLDVEALRRLCDDWAPANGGVSIPLSPPRSLTKAEAREVVRARFPGATPDLVERVIQFSHRLGA